MEGGKRRKKRRERREERERGKKLQLLSTIYGDRVIVVGTRLKVGVCGGDYTWVPETPSFVEVSRGRFVKSKSSGSESVRGTSSGRGSRFKK